MADDTDPRILDLLQKIASDLATLNAMLSEQTDCLIRIERIIAGIQQDRIERRLGLIEV